jgi:hypothetical protein
MDAKHLPFQTDCRIDVADYDSQEPLMKSINDSRLTSLVAAKIILIARRVVRSMKKKINHDITRLMKRSVTSRSAVNPDTLLTENGPARGCERISRDPIDRRR